MARSVRIEYAGAYCHVVARGDRREAILQDEADRKSVGDERICALTPVFLSLKALVKKRSLLCQKGMSSEQVPTYFGMS